MEKNLDPIKYTLRKPGNLKFVYYIEICDGLYIFFKKS